MRGGRRFDDVGRCLYFADLPDSFAWQELKDLCKAYGRVIRADVNRCAVVPWPLSLMAQEAWKRARSAAHGVQRASRWAKMGHSAGGV